MTWLRTLLSSLLIVALSAVRGYAVLPSYNYTCTIEEDVKTGGTYTTMSAAEAGLQQDLTDGGGDILCINMWSSVGGDSTAHQWNGWTTSDSYYVVVRGEPSESNPGVWDTTNKYYFHATNAIAAINLNSAIYIVFDDLQLKNTTTASSGLDTLFYSTAGGPSPVFIGNIINLENNGSSTGGVQALYYTSPLILAWVNNIVFGTGSNSPSAYDAAVNSGTRSIYAYNNTMVNVYTGFTVGTTGSVQEFSNNIFQGHTVTMSAAWTPGVEDIIQNNLCDDTNTYCGAGYSGVQSASLTFNDAGAYDYHLDAVNDTAAIDAGTDLSAAAYPFSIDIDGATRSGTWDIGADETSGPPPPSTWIRWTQ